MVFEPSAGHGVRDRLAGQTDINELSDKFDDKGDTADYGKTKRHQAQVLAIILPGGLFSQPQGLDYFAYLALHYSQVESARVMRYIKHRFVDRETATGFSI